MMKLKKKLGLSLIVILLFTQSLMAGCAATEAQKLPYRRANTNTKDMLFHDLETGAIEEGTTLDYIYSRYGKPEAIARRGKKVLIIYRRPIHNDSAYIWFDDGEHFTDWSK